MGTSTAYCSRLHAKVNRPCAYKFAGPNFLQRHRLSHRLSHPRRHQCEVAGFYKRWKVFQTKSKQVYTANLLFFSLFFNNVESQNISILPSLYDLTKNRKRQLVDPDIPPPFKKSAAMCSCTQSLEIVPMSSNRHCHHR